MHAMPWPCGSKPPTLAGQHKLHALFTEQGTPRLTQWDSPTAKKVRSGSLSGLPAVLLMPCAGTGGQDASGFGQLDPVLKDAGKSWEDEVERGLQTAVPPSPSSPGEPLTDRPAMRELCTGKNNPTLKAVLQAAVDAWKVDPSQGCYAREVAFSDVRVPGLAVGLTGRMDFLILSFTDAGLSASPAEGSGKLPDVGMHPWTGRPGHVTLRVIECKASRAPQVSHLQQLALYRMVLHAALADGGVIGQLGTSLASGQTAVELVLAVKGQQAKGTFKPAAGVPDRCVDVAQVWPTLEPEEYQSHVDDMRVLLRKGGALSKALGLRAGDRHRVGMLVGQPAGSDMYAYVYCKTVCMHAFCMQALQRRHRNASSMLFLRASDQKLYHKSDLMLGFMLPPA